MPAVLLLLATALFANAQSTVCLRLANELAAIDSGGGFVSGGAQYKRYERAAREQKSQIAKTERASRQNNCSRLTLFQANAALCRRIGSSLGEMYANLENLEANLSQLAPRSATTNSKQRRAILAELSVNGCQGRVREQRAAGNPQAPRRRTLLEQLFGVNTYREDGSRSGSQYQPDAELSSRYGTYRTLCVRSCDGYYFPISFSTSKDHFADDEQACQALCPGTEVSLYFHAMPSQDSEDMISYRDDQPYSALPAAFSYRKAVNNLCTCRAPSSGLTEIAGSGSLIPVAADAEPAQALPTPNWRVDQGLDPETQANSGGFLRIDAIDQMARKPLAAVASAPPNRNIRIVGPAFFPVQ